VPPEAKDGGKPRGTHKKEGPPHLYLGDAGGDSVVKKETRQRLFHLKQREGETGFESEGKMNLPKTGEQGDRSILRDQIGKLSGE